MEGRVSSLEVAVKNLVETQEKSQSELLSLMNKMMEEMKQMEVRLSRGSGENDSHKEDESHNQQTSESLTWNRFYRMHPGNIAVDDVNGGRLIFYDFGMMGSISPNIREGLLEAFYGVYEKDPDKVLQSMIQMGVLVRTGDMTAVRRTAQFFLNSFEERLAAQRRERERERATADLGFKKPLSKEENIMKKKQHLAAIGEDLLSIAADQPFRLPTTFTFVVRAFSVLDGIGKGLDPCFDITEIGKLYALELLRFREAGVEVVLKADRVDKLAEIIQRLEQGDLKLRVQTLESERAFQRVATVQKMIWNAVAAGSLINIATVLYLYSIRVPAIIAYVLCAFFGLKILFGIVKVKKLDEQNG